MRKFLSVNNAVCGEITVDGHTYRLANVCDCSFRANAHHNGELHDALVDGGCNGGIAGEDMLLIDETAQQVDVHGIAGASLESVTLGTAVAKVTTTAGPVIGFFHQYALVMKGPSLHLSNQLRAFQNRV